MLSETTKKRNKVADENQAVIRCLFERVYSKGELSLIDNLVTPDFVGESAESSRAYLGPRGIKTQVIRLRTAFHEFTTEIDDLHMQADTFEVAWTARGTHERRFQGVDPTCNLGRVGEEPRGNRFAVSGNTKGTICNRKIHGSRMAWDVAELRRQLGASIKDVETNTGAVERTGRNPPHLEGGDRDEDVNAFHGLVSECR